MAGYQDRNSVSKRMYHAIKTSFGPVLAHTCLVAALPFAPLTARAAEQPPNVILLLADDLGYGDLVAHGNPRLRTPNLDRLRAESVRLTDHHVAPMCTPTRGELLTGVSAFRNGATAVAQGRSIIRREMPLISEIFRDNDYATAHIGKWHLGDNYPFRPRIADSIFRFTEMASVSVRSQITG